MKPQKRRIKRTPAEKWAFCKNAVLAALLEGPKHFNELHEPLKVKAITDHYLSDILADLLLFESSIEQTEVNDERVYSLRK